MTPAPINEPRRWWLSLLVIGAVTVVAMAILLAMAGVSGLGVEDAVADQQELTRHRFLGIVSTAGILVWGSALTICLFAWAAIGPVQEQRRWRSFLLASAGVTFVLLTDDLLLVHEFADDVVSVFVDFERTHRQKDLLEGTVFAGYALMFGIYVMAFRDRLQLARGRKYLLAAFAMFTVSLVVDFGAFEIVEIVLPFDGDPFEILTEEGSKLSGIVYYAAFYFSVAHQLLDIPTSDSADPPSELNVSDTR